jgi:hypothetical protein
MPRDRATTVEDSFRAGAAGSHVSMGASLCAGPIFTEEQPAISVVTAKSKSVLIGEVTANRAQPERQNRDKDP